MPRCSSSHSRLAHRSHIAADAKGSAQPITSAGWLVMLHSSPLRLDCVELTGTVSFDHPDPCIFTVLTCQSAEPGMHRAVVHALAAHDRSCITRCGNTPAAYGAMSGRPPPCTCLHAVVHPSLARRRRLPCRACLDGPTSPVRRRRHRRFRDIPAALGSRRAHVPPAVLSSQLHD